MDARSAGASASVRSALPDTKARFQPTPLRKSASMIKPGSLPGTKPASMTATIRIDAPAPIIRRRPNRSHSQPDSGEVTYMPAR